MITRVLWKDQVCSPATQCRMPEVFSLIRDSRVMLLDHNTLSQECSIFFLWCKRGFSCLTLTFPRHVMSIHASPQLLHTWFLFQGVNSGLWVVLYETAWNLDVKTFTAMHTCKLHLCRSGKCPSVAQTADMLILSAMQRCIVQYTQPGWTQRIWTSELR
jgi:hypothetical protein